MKSRWGLNLLLHNGINNSLSLLEIPHQIHSEIEFSLFTAATHWKLSYFMNFRGLFLLLYCFQMMGSQPITQIGDVTLNCHWHLISLLLLHFSRSVKMSCKYCVCLLFWQYHPLCVICKLPYYISTLVPRSLMKILNKINPWETESVFFFHTNSSPFTTELYCLLFSLFPIYLAVLVLTSIPSSWTNSFPLCYSISALLKQITSVSFNMARKCWIYFLFISTFSIVFVSIFKIIFVSKCVLNFWMLFR